MAEASIRLKSEGLLPKRDAKYLTFMHLFGIAPAGSGGRESWCTPFLAPMARDGGVRKGNAAGAKGAGVQIGIG